MAPIFQTVDVPKREPSEVTQDGCALTIHPETDAGYIQHVDMAGVEISDGSFVWHGDETIGNAIIVLQAREVGKVRWRKPNQNSSPFPYAVIQSARYVKKADVSLFLKALTAEIEACSAL